MKGGTQTLLNRCLAKVYRNKWGGEDNSMTLSLTNCNISIAADMTENSHKIYFIDFYSIFIILLRAFFEKS